MGTTEGVTRERAFSVRATEMTQIEIAMDSGATIVATAQPPPETQPVGLVYWLFTGSAPSSASDARTRSAAEHARTPIDVAISFGGTGAEPARFEDVATGSYAACAGVFDRKTMDAADVPFGCTSVIVREATPLRELAIQMQ